MSNSISAPFVAGRPGAWLPPLSPDPPAWVRRLTGPDQPAGPSGGRFRHVTTVVADATRLAPAQLETAVADAYASMARAFGDTGHHPVRFWNFVPVIHGDMGDGRDRYMVFNAGRFAAFRDWFGSSAVFDRTLPTASAVGIADGALVIHALGADVAGLPVENPRQIPAYAYSRRYGPLPPCFARGTIIHDPAGPRLLVGGTASIVGEASQHERHVREQAAETFHNLAHLIASARREQPQPDASIGALHALKHVRVYIVRPEDADLIRDLVLEAMPGIPSLEFAQADLCRRELLVEIEGYAEI